MKKIILIFAAVIGMATASQAQTAYNMTITKADGTTVVIPADSVTSVTFVEAQTPSGEKSVYEQCAGNWTMTYSDFDGNIQVKDLVVSLPDKSSADYGKVLNVHAPGFVVGSSSKYDIDFKMNYTYDEAAGTGTLSLVVDDQPVGDFVQGYKLFLRLEDTVNEKWVSGEFKWNFTAATNITGDLPSAIRPADRTAQIDLCVYSGDKATEDQPLQVVDYISGARLKLIK